MKRALLCVGAVFDANLLCNGDILDFGDNRERSITNDAQPMHENAEEYLADLNRPAY